MSITFQTYNTLQSVQTTVMRKSIDSTKSLAKKVINMADDTMKVNRQQQAYLKRADKMLLPHTGNFVSTFA